MGNIQGVTSFDEPEFENLEVKENAPYMLRKYKKACWTSTVVAAPTPEKTSSTGFRRLFNYIRGTNESQNKLAMTVPVTMAMKSDAPVNEAGGMEMIMSFYVPKEYQENPPVPTGEGVYTENREEITVYVRRFGGFAKGQVWKTEVENLRADLAKDGILDVDPTMYYGVGYDSPFRPIWRTNEVWLKKLEQ